MAGISEYARTRVLVLGGCEKRYTLPNRAPMRTVYNGEREVAVFSLTPQDQNEPAYVTQAEKWCVWRSGPTSTPVFIKRALAAHIETLSRNWLMEPTTVDREGGIPEVVGFAFYPVAPADALALANIQLQ